MFCPKCGAQNPDGAKFCKGCGAPLGGRPATAPYTGAPAPAAAPTHAMGPRLKARVPAIVAVVAVVAVLVVGLATSWFSPSADDGLKAGTYYLKNSNGSTAMMLNVYNDGIVGITDSGGETIEGKGEVTNSNGHLVMELSDLRGSRLSKGDAIYAKVTLVLPSGLSKGSYAGDYAVAFVTSSGSSSGAVEWLQLRDDGSASYKEYVCGLSSSDKDPSVIIGSIANGSWSDAQAKTATWRASDPDGSGFDVYDTSGNAGASGSYEPFK